jgi:HD-GYP domain-containing protein (c-di-GMP phosphodiesterase class II)
MSLNDEKICGGINDNYSINLFLISLIAEVQKFTEDQHAQIKRLTEIGTALSAEKNLDRLLEMIVDEARKFTNADAGTLYIMSDDETELNFAIVQNNSLGVRMGGAGGEIIWPSVNLKNADGSANNANVSAYVAISGETVNIPDVYDPDGFNFEGTKKFDLNTGYRSKSMLVVPLRNHENDIIGVLQLLNALDAVTGEVIEFSSEYQEMVLSLASQAAVALSNNRLIHDLENLLESFIRTIATAIDEKSPYTGGHVKRVAELTMTMAHKVNSINYGKFAGFEFSDDQLQELRMAAWLHDVGKITTPEYVIDKATKLQTVHDRIHDVKIRIELLKRDCLPATPSAIIAEDKHDDKNTADAQAAIKALDEDFHFLAKANVGNEFMKDEMIDRIKKIAGRSLCEDGRMRSLLSDEEVYNLCIRRGTLTEEERNIINNHALVTHKMLSQLPFPRKMRHIADYASAHHEKIDGTGYPLGLKGDQLSLQSRIIAIADIFEALTAKDRPYKKGKSLAEALEIMDAMAKDNHIDADLYELFVKEKVYEEYAKNNSVPSTA